MTFHAVKALPAAARDRVAVAVAEKGFDSGIRWIAPGNSERNGSFACA